MNVLTISGYNKIVSSNIGEIRSFDDELGLISSISYKTIKELKRMQPDAYNELKTDYLAQCLPASPVFAVRYKGEVYGYEPPEMDTVEAMCGMELFQQTKNLEAMAALMFRPMSSISKILHSKFDEVNGSYVKIITSFPKNYITYKTKSINFSKLDAEHFSDFPVQPLLSALVFSMGSGLKYSVNTPPSFLTHEKLNGVINKRMEKIQLLLTSSIAQRAYPALECLSSTRDHQSWNLNQENSLTGSLTSTIEQLKKELYKLNKVLCDYNLKTYTNGVVQIMLDLLDGKFTTENLIALSAIGKQQKTMSKLNLLLWQR